MWTQLTGHYYELSWLVTIMNSVDWSLLWTQLTVTIMNSVDGHYYELSWLVTILTSVDWSLLWTQLTGHYYELSWLVTIMNSVAWSILWTVTQSCIDIFNSDVDIGYS